MTRGQRTPRLSAAPEGRRAARIRARPARFPGGGRDAARVLPRRATTSRGSSGCSSGCTIGEMWVPARGHAAALARSSIRCCWPGTGRTSTPATPRSAARDAVVMRKAWTVAPGPLRPEIVAAVEAELQKTAPGAPRARRQRAGRAARRSRRPDRRGDRRARGRRPRGAGRPRCSPSAGSRAVEFAGGRRAWIPATDATLYAGLATDAGVERLALRVLRTRGPVTAEWLGERYGVPAPDVTAALDRLVARGVVRHGSYLRDRSGRRAVRARGRARRDPAPAGSRAAPAAAGRHGRAVLGVPAAASPPASRASPGRPARRAGRARAAAGRRRPAARVGARPPVRPRRGLSPRVARSSRAGRRDRVDGVRASAGDRARGGRVGVALRDNVGWLREGAERPALDGPDQERAAPPAAARRLVRA